MHCKEVGRIRCVKKISQNQPFLVSMWTCFSSLKHLTWRDQKVWNQNSSSSFSLIWTVVMPSFYQKAKLLYGFKDEITTPDSFCRALQVIGVRLASDCQQLRPIYNCRDTSTYGNFSGVRCHGTYSQPVSAHRMANKSQMKRRLRVTCHQAFMNNVSKMMLSCLSPKRLPPPFWCWFLSHHQRALFHPRSCDSNISVRENHVVRFAFLGVERQNHRQ